MSGTEEWLGHPFVLIVPAAVKGPHGEQSNFGLLSPVQEWQSQVSPEFGMQKSFCELLLCCAKFHLPTAGDEATSDNRFSIPLMPFAWNKCSPTIASSRSQLCVQQTSTIMFITHSGYSLQSDYLIKSNSELRSFKTDKNFLSLKEED